MSALFAAESIGLHMGNVAVTIRPNTKRGYAKPSANGNKSNQNSPAVHTIPVSATVLVAKASLVTIPAQCVRGAAKLLCNQHLYARLNASIAT